MTIDVSAERAELDRFEDRRDEYLSALAHARAQNQPRQVLALAGPFAQFLQRRSYWGTGEQILSWALEAAESLDEPHARAQMLDELGTLHRLQSKLQLAAREFTDALNTFRTVGDRVGEARAQSNLGLVLRKQGDLPGALDSFRRSLELWQALEGSLSEDERLRGRARSINNLGMALRDEGDLDQAERAFAEALQLRESLGDADGVSRTLNNIGQLEMQRGEPRRAIEYHERALELREGLGDVHGIARTRHLLAAALEATGELDSAARLLASGLSLRQQLGDRAGEAQTAVHLGRVLTGMKRLDEARAVLDRAIEIADELNDQRTLAMANTFRDRLS